MEEMTDKSSSWSLLFFVTWAHGIYIQYALAGLLAASKEVCHCLC